MIKKKILLISHSLNSSGAPKALLELIKNKPSYIDSEVCLLGLRFNDLKKEFAKYINNMKIITPYPSKNSFVDLAQRIMAIPKIIYYLIYIKPNLIVINSAANSRALIVSSLLKRIFNYKIILYVHEYEETFRAFKFLRKKTICLADKILVVNNDQEKWIKDKLGCNKNIFVIPNGINFEEIAYLIKENPEDRFLQFINKYNFIVSNVGILTKIKGFDLFLDIIKNFKGQDDIAFVIIGDFLYDKDRYEFISKLKQEGLDDRVYITGVTKNIFKYLKYSNCVTITSRSETFSRVALESMSIGIPVIAFNIKGLRETLPSNYPYLASPFNTNEFVNLVLEIYNLSEKDRRHLKEMLKAHSIKFDIKKISNLFWKIIKEEL
ncbi:glycosyltransferase [Thermosulfurimonas marina]|nr:glycosyltransferase [Thermosulfurimonas marina]